MRKLPISQPLVEKSLGSIGTTKSGIVAGCLCYQLQLELRIRVWTGSDVAEINLYPWEKHYRGLLELLIAA